MTALGFLPLLTLIASETSDVKRDEAVQFFPTGARYLANDEVWEVPIHGWIYETEFYPHKR